MFERRAAAVGLGVEQWLEQWGRDVTLLGRLPTLAQVADTAVFLASDRAAAITGAVIDLTCGNAVRSIRLAGGASMREPPVPGAGIEPARPCGRRGLSPPRLPVPPPGPVVGEGTGAHPARR